MTVLVVYHRCALEHVLLRLNVKRSQQLCLSGSKVRHVEAFLQLGHPIEGVLPVHYHVGNGRMCNRQTLAVMQLLL